ncbi:MAG: hypothetical protein QOH21_3343 [Acidobacteriota bacterium]|jgi:hypothetical protein|nr:hypothetical protein [Acidobacteriota bacterium]
MRRRFAAFVLFATACSQEHPAPPPSTATAPPAVAPSTTAQLTPAPATPPQRQTAGTYQQGMDWLRSTRGFHFVLVESGVRATGDMARPTVGAERVRFTADGAEWLATAKPTGVTWYRRNAGKWQHATPPVYGDRVYQRVTLAFDPQKKEPEPILAGGDAATNLYRFTNANTGETHELWIAKKDGHVERVKIGDAVEITFTELRADVPTGG